MFFVKSVFLFLVVFSAEIGVYSQMDVSLKKATIKPFPHENSPSGNDADAESGNTSPENQDLLKRHERFQDKLRKIGVLMDSEINNPFNLFPHTLNPSILENMFNEQKQIRDRLALPSSREFMSIDDDGDEDSISDLQSPINNFFKFLDNPMFPVGSSVGADPRFHIDRKVSTTEQGNEDEQPIGVLTIIKIDGDEPLQGNVLAPDQDDVKKTLMDQEMGSKFVQGFLNGVVGAMKDMVDLVRNTTIGLNAGGTVNENGTEPQVDIMIKDHGKTYDIPHNAYVERTEPDLVNITWRSELKDLNNSLCMNVSKDADGQIVFHHIRLRMMNGQGLHEYNKEDPVHIGKNKENRTEINLADGIGLEFPHPDSLDVVVVEKGVKFSSHWMAVSIALLGLIVAGLIMLLSYILHSRNRYNTRKDSMSKQPIA